MYVEASQLLNLALTTFALFFFVDAQLTNSAYACFFFLLILIFFHLLAGSAATCSFYFFGVNVRCCASLGLWEGALLVT